MRHKIFNTSLILIAGIFIGWLVFHRSGESEGNHEHHDEVEQAEIWTCAMHPHIKMSEPGKCAICGMDLIPLVQSNTMSIDPDALQMTPESARLADVATAVVSRQNPAGEVRLYGKVQPDERLLQSQVAHVSGRIEKLAVNFTGIAVSRGETLAELYSPDLITAQQELLETTGSKLSQPEIYEAAKEKLRQLKLTEEQISDIEESGKISPTLKIVANTSGIVTTRRVNTGDYVSKGSVLFEISDLSRIWVIFDAYERDLQFLRRGGKVTYTVQALPGNKYTGIIDFIDPVIDPVTRVAKVRVEAGNPYGNLKPEMLVTGIITTDLKGYNDRFVIPASSVLWTGKRSIVYVKLQGTDEPVFKIREIELGPSLGENYVVMEGLSEGDEIVVSGTFSVDAAAQLEGKPSMMNLPQAPIGNSIVAKFMVAGLCSMCKERIEEAALSVAGVHKAVWNMEKTEIVITYDPDKTDVSAVQKAIAASGHDNDGFKADDDVYSRLPECCLYRKEK